MLASMLDFVTQQLAIDFADASNFLVIRVLRDAPNSEQREIINSYGTVPRFSIKDGLLVVTRRDGAKTLLLVVSIGVHGCPGSRVLRMWLSQSFLVTGMTLLAVISRPSFQHLDISARICSLSLTVAVNCLVRFADIKDGALIRCLTNHETHRASYRIKH